MEFKNGLDVLVYILKDELEQQLEEDRLKKANEDHQQLRSRSESPEKELSPPSEKELSPSPSPAKKARSEPEISSPSANNVKKELGLGFDINKPYRAKQVRVSNPKTKRVSEIRAPAPEPDMPEAMRDHITLNKRGGDIKLVIQKYLCQSDVLRNNHRFSIPVAKVRQQFLTPEEEEFFKGRDGKGKKREREVTLVEPTVRDETVVHFKRWEMEKSNGGRTSSSYVITHTWMDVVGRNGFREGDLVQLWSFRVGPELNFAMVLVERAN